VDSEPSPAMTEECRRLVHAAGRARWSSEQRRIQVLPLGVHLLDQPDLPRTGPLLDVLFPLNGWQDLLVPLEPNQALQAVSARESRLAACSVLPTTPDNVRRYANLQRAILSVRHDVNIPAAHLIRHRAKSSTAGIRRSSRTAYAGRCKGVDGGPSPAMTGRDRRLAPDDLADTQSLAGQS
jgi:hypothetical protein